MKHTPKLSIAALLTSTLLAACGGGGDSDSGGTNGAQQPAAANSQVPAVTTDCPASYKSITLNQSSVLNANLSLVVGNATFSFKTPSDKTPSLKVCMGLATNLVLPSGIYAISPTYEILTIPLDSSNAGLADLITPTLTVKFTFGEVPAGLNFVPGKSDVSAYYDDHGTLKTTLLAKNRTSSLSPNPSPGDSRLTSGEFAFMITEANKYVVGFKP